MIIQGMIHQRLDILMFLRKVLWMIIGKFLRGFFCEEDGIREETDGGMVGS